MTTQRIYWLDYLRVLACFLVILVHVKPFGSNYVESIYTHFSRIAVPIFFMISGYLTLPQKGGYIVLFKERLPRLVFPFIFWSVLYAFIPFIFSIEDLDHALNRFTNLPFSLSASHLWYMYSIIGLYLFSPIISPWLETVSRKDLIVVLVLWGFTLFFTYLRIFFPWLRMTEWYSLYAFYYFSGYLGFFLLGYFLKKYPISYAEKNRWVLAVIFLLGLTVLYYVFWVLDERYKSIQYKTINVALIALSVFLFIKSINFKDHKISIFISHLAKKSFGIYLVHEIFLLLINNYFLEYFTQFNLGARLVESMIVFALSYVLVSMLQKFPFSKYLIG